MQHTSVEEPVGKMLEGRVTFLASIAPMCHKSMHLQLILASMLKTVASSQDKIRVALWYVHTSPFPVQLGHV